MVDEKLLTTYSLLSYIRESYGTDKKDSLLYTFVPLVKRGLNLVLEKHCGKELMGKDYSEIQDALYEEYHITIPIPVLYNVLPVVQEEVGECFTLNRDHSFIIKKRCVESIDKDYQYQKSCLERLCHHYTVFCHEVKVKPDFENLIDFIQDQKNRLFEGRESVVEGQNYHISKYVNDRIKHKDAYFETICRIYLGGIIASYYSFHISKTFVDTELLIDTNFYISLVNLNTEESYATCKQLYEITVPMGYRYKILETTIDQIRILLSKRVSNFGNRDIFSALDQADILAACKRRDMSQSELETYKDNLLVSLSQLGISTVYTNQIRTLADKTRRSKELPVLTRKRGNEQSAFNDLLAQEYVDYKRTGKAIVEFNDVNCWFLNNSYSVSSHEQSLPVWQRRSISASDLLTILWLSNPSLDIGDEKSMLSVFCLSANVLKYRSDKLPTTKVINELNKKVARLQQTGNISEGAIAKLCIRMSEGCIDKNESERLVTLTSSDFLKYIDTIQEHEDAYLTGQMEIQNLREQIKEISEDKRKTQIESDIKVRRLSSIIYIIIIFVVYICGLYLIPVVKKSPFNMILDFTYWIVTTVVVNWLNHGYFLDGLRSFWAYDKVYKKLSCKTDK